uniref:Protein phosphatase inhibitor 2 n=1 Tax=Rhinopithecus roxellana TaxID=61622 RepID=A0A2K6QR91_RHIRO
MAAWTTSHRSIKGILKTTSSVVASAEQPHGNVDELLSKKSRKWDEMNILAIYHPADKDYGLMKTDEPSTSSHCIMGDDEDACSDTDTTENTAPDILAKKLAAAEGSEPKYRVQEQDSSGKEDSNLSPEEQEKKKLHYNEGLNIKLTADGESMNKEESNQGSTASDQRQNKSRSS